MWTCRLTSRPSSINAKTVFGIPMKTLVADAIRRRYRALETEAQGEWRNEMAT
jgi:hypothetical protein